MLKTSSSPIFPYNIRDGTRRRLLMQPSRIIFKTVRFTFEMHSLRTFAFLAHEVKKRKLREKKTKTNLSVIKDTIQNTEEFFKQKLCEIKGAIK